VRHQTSWKRRATWGALTGGLLTGVVSAIAGMITAGVYPMLRVEALDPFFLEHAVLALTLLGMYTGAVIGGLTMEPRIT
jgi:hypothetical protein